MHVDVRTECNVILRICLMERVMHIATFSHLFKKYYCLYYTLFSIEFQLAYNLL